MDTTLPAVLHDALVVLPVAADERGERGPKRQEGA